MRAAWAGDEGRGEIVPSVDQLGEVDHGVGGRREEVHGLVEDGRGHQLVHLRPGGIDHDQGVRGCARARGARGTGARGGGTGARGTVHGREGQGGPYIVAHDGARRLDAADLIVVHALEHLGRVQQNAYMSALGPRARQSCVCSCDGGCLAHPWRRR